MASLPSEQQHRDETSLDEQELGILFKQKRIEKGLSINDIAKATKINSKYIKAIEENNISRLVEAVYRYGYIKSYAKYFNINIKFFIYNDLLPSPPKPIEQQSEIILIKEDLSTKYIRKILPVACILVFILFYFAYYTIKTKDSKDIVTLLEQKLAHDLALMSSFHHGFTPAKLDQTEIFQKSDENEYVVVANESTRLKVFDQKSRLIIEKKIAPGEVLFLPIEQKLFVNSKTDVSMYDIKSLETFNPTAVILDKEYKTYFVKKF
ncbi:helix-turn-helix domain-containing protein [Rickettsiales endosymbiont of Stachyamoeba lipophora]|uniref:helix-turn-helix domain-containing protein n=1 Tax=Rickettsiales endosymbiont of Stachyamoeba lipophora TaxID=2486578 RepID=UPI000F6505C7|nr:helix-turn-helix domain-containing protein [Rickettsiales endosymbiont of Stachyamoeba lipophora]AZL15144.1 hypothetical protein EF513_01025 [Rickettsiales endosymbiont of Stachyamoeba lipophora]